MNDIKTRGGIYGLTYKSNQTRLYSELFRRFEIVIFSTILRKDSLKIRLIQLGSHLLDEYRKSFVSLSVLSGFLRRIARLVRNKRKDLAVFPNFQQGGVDFLRKAVAY